MRSYLMASIAAMSLVAADAVAKEWNNPGAEAALQQAVRNHKDLPNCAMFTVAAHNGGTGDLIAAHPNSSGENLCKNPMFLHDPETGRYPSLTAPFVDDVMVDFPRCEGHAGKRL